MSEDHVVNTGGVGSGENPNDMAPDGVGSNGVGTGAPPTPNWREFIDGLNSLNTNLGTKLDGIQSTVTDSARPPPAAPPSYDEMSNTELVAHVTGTMSEAIQSAIMAALQPLTTQIADMQGRLLGTQGSIEMKELQAQHKDFKDWKDEMIALAKQHASLSLKDVYDLAKARNPEKVRQMEAKYNPPAPKPRPFGGLTPSALAGKAVEPVMGRDEATSAAYREVMERHPGVLPLLQDL